MQNQLKKNILLFVALAIIVAAMAGIYYTMRPAGQPGDKTFSLSVAAGDSIIYQSDIRTQAAYLGEALQNEALIEGSISQFGMYITTVYGVEADPGLQQWWCITKDGSSVDTGVDLTPIEDGDRFELTLMEGY